MTKATTDQPPPLYIRAEPVAGRDTSEAGKNAQSAMVTATKSPESHGD